LGGRYKGALGERVVGVEGKAQQPEKERGGGQGTAAGKGEGGRARHTSRKRRARTRRGFPALLPPERAGQQALGGHGAQARG
jgi:hypothetical protein